ncbi:MAG: tilS [Bacillales bacterium]|jgi:tRNA(Ile)-lysidine synthase|nr:tilS [Bacillales bacterium]
MMFENKVWHFIKKNKLLYENETIVIGVSGSVDSLTLLYFLAQNAGKMKWQLIVAHVDHMFRKEESQKDLEFVAEHCKKLDVTFEGIQINVPEIIRQSNKNGQQAARDCRYTFFQDVMSKYQAQKLVLAHHLDDQAETMIMNLTREVSSSGKLGIPVQRRIESGTLVRPFLCVSKAEIEAQCNKLGLFPRIDSSNEKLTYTRNRFRKHVIPFLKNENPKALNHFSAINTLLSEDDAFLQELAKQEFEKLKLEKKQDAYLLDLKAFRMLKKPLQRRILPLILNSLTSLKHFSFSSVHIGLILALVEDSHPSRTIQVDENFYVMKSFEQLLFCFESKIYPNYEEFLIVPGKTLLPNGDVILTELLESFEDSGDLSECLIPVAYLPLKVRNKKNGDKIVIQNLSGRKKLKKVLLEQKIPVYLRNHWPVIVTNGLSEEEILWVPNLVRAKMLNNEYQEKTFVKLTFLTSTYLGGANNGNSQ